MVIPDPRKVEPEEEFELEHGEGPPPSPPARSAAVAAIGVAALVCAVIVHPAGMAWALFALALLALVSV